MLFDPARHEALCDTPWDAGQAQAALQDIVDDIERSRGPQGHWPVHPLDEEGDTPAGGFKGLYLGSAGLGWALWGLDDTMGFDAPRPPGRMGDGLAPALDAAILAALGLVR